MATNGLGYKDLSYKGAFSNDYENIRYPFILKDIEAIKNIIKMYLMSNQGDYGREITRGGPLISILNKQINDASEDMIKETIQAAMGQYANITIINTTVTRDTIGRGWRIKIDFSDNLNKYVTSLNLTIEES